MMFTTLSNSMYPRTRLVNLIYFGIFYHHNKEGFSFFIRLGQLPTGDGYRVSENNIFVGIVTRANILMYTIILLLVSYRNMAVNAICLAPQYHRSLISDGIRYGIIEHGQVIIIHMTRLDIRLLVISNSRANRNFRLTILINAFGTLFHRRRENRVMTTHKYRHATL